MLKKTGRQTERKTDKLAKRDKREGGREREREICKHKMDLYV